MTMIRQRALRIAGLLLATGILLSFLGGVIQAAGLGRGPWMPNIDNQVLNAGVTIKTQKAADNIKGGMRGIDVSKYQGDIDWKKVAGSDVQFAFIRASYGTTNDPKFLSNARSAHKNGLKVGAYHFATFTNSATVKKEAAHFIARLKKVDITYPVVLDLEGASHKKIKKSTLTKLANQFMDLVKAEGYTVMLYSYNNFIRDHLDVGKLDYDLWVANYLEQPQSIPHKVWQHTSYGTVSGIQGRVDINIAYEDLSTNKKIKVDKAISDSIKATLNERYDAGLAMDKLNMKQMNTAVTAGLQSEINRQWGENLDVDGKMSTEVLDYIASVSFDESTKGNITYLLQVKLFYKGFYDVEPTSQFDSNTVKSLKAFQKAKGLRQSGTFDGATLEKLLL